MGERAIRDLRLVFSVDTGRAQAEIRKLKKEMGGMSRATARLNKQGKRFTQTSNSLRMSFVSGWRRPIAQVRSDILMLTFALGGLIGAVRSFIRESKEAEMALKGLSSIAEGFGHNVGDVTAAAQEFADTGLLTISEAANTLKYLISMEGVSLDLAKSAMRAAMDWAAFSRLGQYEFGQALQVWARGMKEQRSQVTDVIGWVTNLNNAWKKYAERLGTTVGRLTDAQKNVGGLTIMMEEGVKVSGDSIKYLDTYAGQLSILKTSWKELARFLGDTLLPILRDVLVPITDQIDAWKEYIEANKELISLKVREYLEKIYKLVKPLGSVFLWLGKNIDKIGAALEILIPLLVFAKVVSAIGLVVASFVKVYGWILKVVGGVKAVHGGLTTLWSNFNVWAVHFGSKWKAFKVIISEVTRSIMKSKIVASGFLKIFTGAGFVLTFFASLAGAIKKMFDYWNKRSEKFKKDITDISKIAWGKEEMAGAEAWARTRLKYLDELSKEKWTFLKKRKEEAKTDKEIAEYKEYEVRVMGRLRKIERARMETRANLARQEVIFIGKEILANKELKKSLKDLGLEEVNLQIGNTSVVWHRLIEKVTEAKKGFEEGSDEIKILDRALVSLQTGAQNAADVQVVLTEEIMENTEAVEDAVEELTAWQKAYNNLHKDLLGSLGTWGKYLLMEEKYATLLKLAKDEHAPLIERQRIRIAQLTEIAGLLKDINKVSMPAGMEAWGTRQSRPEEEFAWFTGVVRRKMIPEEFEEWGKKLKDTVKTAEELGIVGERTKDLWDEYWAGQDPLIDSAKEKIAAYMDLGRSLGAIAGGTIESNLEIKQRLDSELKNLQQQYQQGAIDRIELQHRTEKAIIDSEARIANNTAQMWKGMFSTVTDFMLDVFAEYLKKQVLMKAATSPLAGAGLGLLGGLALGAAGVGLGFLATKLFPEEEVSPYMPISPGGGAEGAQRRTFGSMAQAPVQNISIIPSVSIRGDNVWIGAGTVEELELGLEDLIKKTTQDAVDNNEIDLAGVGPR